MESATLVAVTEYEPAAFGAVYRPLLVTVPPEAVHVTAVFVVPVMLAVNCICCPKSNESVPGERLTDTLREVLPEPYNDTRHDDDFEPDDHVGGKVVSPVCWLETE